MDVETKEYLGYTIELTYRPFFDESKPKSQQHKVVVKKAGMILINQYGFTRNEAINYAQKWIDKQNK